MKEPVGRENAAAEDLLPPAQPDRSGLGVNYADAYLKALGGELAGGRKVSCKRKGLKLTLQVGEAKGEALLRRQNGPDPRAILRRALEEAAAAAGARFSVEEGTIYLEVIA